MKKILFAVVLALTVSVANAWNKFAEEGLVILASKHLTTEARTVLNQYLGDNYADDVHYLHMLEREKEAKHSKEIHYLHLDSDLQPMNVEGDDAFKAIEKSLEVVRARNTHSNEEVVVALRTIISLMCDIHHISYVRIEGVEHSQQNFKFSVYAGDIGRRKTLSSIKWSSMWFGYSNRHLGFSGSLWAEDIELCLGEQRAELSRGSLRDWISHIGYVASNMYAKINPEYVMTRREYNELEVLNYEMMARAGYRLSSLLNDVLK